MQLKPWFFLGLASLTTASQFSQMDAPAVKSSLATINTAILDIDKSVLAITQANVVKQMDNIVAKMTATNKVMTETAALMTASKPLGIMDIMGLSTPMQNFGKTVTKLMDDLMAKREIIVTAGVADKLGVGLKASKTGFNALSNAVMAQMPAQMTKGMPKGGASNQPSALEIDKMTDTMFDVIISVFKGEEATITIPAGVLPLKSGTPKAAPAPAAPAKYVDFRS